MTDKSNQSSYVRCRVPHHMETHLDGTTVAIKHCHDNSHAREDREREKKVARKRLCLASVICLIFMISEIIGESRPFFLPWNQWLCLMPSLRWVGPFLHMNHDFTMLWLHDLKSSRLIFWNVPLKSLWLVRSRARPTLTCQVQFTLGRLCSGKHY